MFAFLNLGVQELTILLVFGGLVVAPLIVGIIALSLTCKAEREKHPK
jgi:hypothetical protein